MLAKQSTRKTFASPLTSRLQEVASTGAALALYPSQDLGRDPLTIAS